MASEYGFHRECRIRSAAKLAGKDAEIEKLEKMLAKAGIKAQIMHKTTFGDLIARFLMRIKSE